MLKLESEMVTRTYRGIGLEDKNPPPPAPESPKPKTGSNA